MPRLGAHMSVAGGLPRAVERAVVHGCEAMQIFAKNANQWTAATFAAARTRTAQIFLGFSRFPAARTFADPTGATTVRWTDVRFVGGPLSVEATRPANLFNVVVRLDADGRVLDERIGR